MFELLKNLKFVILFDNHSINILEISAIFNFIFNFIFIIFIIFQEVQTKMKMKMKDLKDEHEWVESTNKSISKGNFPS